MEPHIRYVRSADGTRIATATIGSGPSLVMTYATTLSPLEAQWAMEPERAIIERIARTYTVVRFDTRGMGLSDKDATDYSLEAYVSDLEAVFASLPNRPAFLFSRGNTAPAVIAFTARHPEQVRRLALRAATPRGSDYTATPKRRAVGALLDVDWELYCNTLAQVDLGWTEAGRQYGIILARSTTPDLLRACMRGSRAHDASDALQWITCPTLVIHEPLIEFVLAEESRQLAALLPSARMQVFPAQVVARTLQREVVDAVLGFFDEDRPEATKVDLPDGTAIILFADIADSTALTERLGDAAFREKARDLDSALRTIISEAGGKAIEGYLSGDGVLATFPAASQAIDAALRCGGAGDAQGLPLHLGLHAGDVIRESDNVFGGAVNIASRVSALSAPGEVLVSDIVRGLARTSAGVSFEDRGEHALKGITDPQRVFAVRPT